MEWKYKIRDTQVKNFSFVFCFCFLFFVFCFFFTMRKGDERTATPPQRHELVELDHWEDGHDDDGAQHGLGNEAQRRHEEAERQQYHSTCLLFPKIIIIMIEMTLNRLPLTKQDPKWARKLFHYKNIEKGFILVKRHQLQFLKTKRPSTWAKWLINTIESH